MKTSKIALLAVLVGVSGASMAAYDGSREDRMQSALDDYRNGAKQGSTSAATTDSTARDTRYHDARNPSPGPAARAEESMKRGASDAGHAIKRGASKVGHAVGTGLHKSGEAIDHAGEKLKGKTSDQ